MLGSQEKEVRAQHCLTGAVDGGAGRRGEVRDRAFYMYAPGPFDLRHSFLI